MGKRNREKRAAKKRTRQGRGPTPSRYDFADGGEQFTMPQSIPPELVAQSLLHAAHAQASGNETAAAEFARTVLRGPTAAGPRVAATGAAMAMDILLGGLWQAGWTPVDLWQHSRRTCPAPATSLLLDAIAADAAKHASSTVDDRWAEQVRALGAERWWDRDRPQLLQWADRAGVAVDDALLTMVTLLAELSMLPELPVILPPPGSAGVRPAQTGHGVDQKVLARVRGLLAKAESTEFPEEAEALSAKAQELMNRYSFERALLDADTDRKQTAASTRLWLDAPYVEAKSHLVGAIAEANRCRTVFYAKLGFVALVGAETDLEITELLATSLQVQATRAMVAHGSQTTRAGTSRTRSFRHSFLVSYAVRIGERLEEAGRRAHDPVEDERLLPVLAARSRVVEETFETMFHHVVERTTAITNGVGWEAGRAAADHADLVIQRQAVDA
ncbi:DUF2786 domain-containing protein [Amycolatopsis sp. lyj-109]|uniref:DUF2786 domain-containing protein n=1 Tax=Amycolatopsis sp. lyj-109 TaxID=2789287 RepID=UPI00397D2DAA